MREPIGVVGQIIPWNFPLLMAAWKLAPALGCGCTVVLKLAEQTPMSGLRLAELIRSKQAFPPAWSTSSPALAKAPAPRSPRIRLVDKIAFTGSTEVGKLIVKAAAGNLKKVTLELGGKCPAIVFPDADLDRAIAGTASAIFFNQGQCCCAGSRLFVHESVYRQGPQGVSDIAGEINMGPGLDPHTADGTTGQRRTIRQGHRLYRLRHQGGRKRRRRRQTPSATAGYFVQPTVLTNTKPNMKVVQEEIFGPVVCAESFSDADLDRMAREANDTIYGLAASVWTRDLSTAHKMARRIRSGTVWINCHNVFDASLPFGGYKQSGWGREMGEEVLHNYTEVKAVTAAL